MSPKALSDPKKRVYVILEEAQLETAKVGKGFELLNSDDHRNFLFKHKKDPADYRPDVCHQMLMTLLDSPLNKAGHLKVFIRTRKNVLIDVNPGLRIPRTFKRFAGLMVQLLHKLKIRSEGGNERLLNVIKNPVTDHLPVGCKKIGTSVDAKLVKPVDFVKALPEEPVCFVFGAIARGHISPDYVEDNIAVSEYALSGMCALSRLLGAFEIKWNVL